MSIFALLWIAIGGAFAIGWLIHYLPLRSTFLGKAYSPRLAACRVVAPFDAVMTFILIGGSWVGLGTAVMGIGMMVYNVLTGIGLSMGAVIVRKVLMPRWKKQYEALEDKEQRYKHVEKHVREAA
jgi:hypothetical protein